MDECCEVREVPLEQRRVLSAMRAARVASTAAVALTIAPEDSSTDRRKCRAS
jgi:hypothetical protein